MPGHKFGGALRNRTGLNGFAIRYLASWLVHQREPLSSETAFHSRGGRLSGLLSRPQTTQHAVIWRCTPESNRAKRICNPSPNRLDSAPHGVDYSKAVLRSLQQPLLRRRDPIHIWSTRPVDAKRHKPDPAGLEPTQGPARRETCPSSMFGARGAYVSNFLLGRRTAFTSSLCRVSEGSGPLSSRVVPAP